MLLRPANTTGTNSADHIAVLDQALAQLPPQVGSRVAVRADSGGSTTKFLTHVAGLGLPFRSEPAN